ncbi:MAG: AI-2E family transporter [Firmicutes bacterium]|nr:AI-2E family transporter [Bacillota bacterium]
MFRKDNSNKLDIKSINESVGLLSKILRITYIFVIVIGIYAITLISKEWGIFKFLGTILNILTPFFIGFVIAWLFNPIVTWLNKQKVNRVLGTIIVYLVFLGFIYIMLSAIFPLLAEQVNDIVVALPGVINGIKDFINDFFKNLSNPSLDLNSIKIELLGYISNLGKNLTSSLPSKVMGIITSVFSGLGTFGIGLIIGFYMLFNFDNVSKTMISFFPKPIRDTAKDLLGRINETLFGYVQGTLFVSFVVFITSYIGFLLIGVKAPLLFATFCGITNIIPYVGPFIGGFPVALVTLSQNIAMGVLVIIYIVGVQWLESMILQPIVMSKAMKLHPVTILIGLLIFEHFFGIVGMIVATPIIATTKTLFQFFDEKYHLTRYVEE